VLAINVRKATALASDAAKTLNRSRAMATELNRDLFIDTSPLK